ncbi:MAG: transcription-repair coupling factor, partial [Phenylobacterium sp.]
MADDASRPVSAAQLRRVAEDPGRLDLVGAPEGFDALVMADVVRARKGLSVFVARDGARLSAFVEAFRFFAPGVEILTFPAWDCLPYDRIGPSPGVAAQRMTALSRLAIDVEEKKPRLLVTTVPALLQRVPPKSVVQRASYSARGGNTVQIADLEAYFAINGYQRASTVSERGEFAIRGGVIDVFPPNAEEPVRLDLFGDTLESIRAFDPETQRSTKQLKEVNLLPVSEALLDKEAISRFRTGYLESFGAAGDDPLYATVSEGGRRAGMEHWLPLFYPSMATLFDYLPKDAVIALDHLSREARDERLALIADAYESRAQVERRVQYHPLEPNRLYLTAAEWQAELGPRATRRFSAFNEAEGEAVIDMGARAGRNFSAERKLDSVNLFEATVDHANKLSAAGKRVLFASWSDGSSDRLMHMLADHGLKSLPLAPYWDAAKAADPKKPQRVVLPL